MHTEGQLFIVATPIGNLEDITLRALRILKEVDYIAAEDTRHTRKLLSHFGIQTKLISYYREKEHAGADHLLALLNNGKDIAVVTDAGTPGVSDPGSVVVQKAMLHNYKVIPLPGASALTTALSCAGIREGSILFHGFAPAKKSQRRQLLKSLIHSNSHTVFYESPRRVNSFVADAHDILGDRQIFVARELTKAFEELTFTSLSQLNAQEQEMQTRGEYVLILWPGEKTPTLEKDVDELIIWYRDNTNVSMKDCCKLIAADLGESRSKIYQKAIPLWQKK